jgi:hypothetical protein
MPILIAVTLDATEPILSDGCTVTCGDDVVFVTPQHDIPIFPGVDYYKPAALMWNYKAVQQKSYNDIDDYYKDGWHFRSMVVDFFSHTEGLRRKALVVRGIPYAKPDDIDDPEAQSLVDNTLRDSMFTLVYYVVPTRPTAVSDEMEVQEPFIKYIEYQVAARLLKSFYQLRNAERASHLEARYKFGVALTRRVVTKQETGRSRRLGPIGSNQGMKPHYPRLPQHYPRLRLR